MKKILLICALLLCVSSIRTYAEEPFKDVHFQAACEEAKKGEKVIIIDFFTTWCGPCKQMDKTTWKDETVQNFLKEKAVALKIDAEKEVDLAKRYKINAYPTILILKADGTEIDRIVGYRPATEFISETKDSLAGKTSVMRAKEKLQGNIEKAKGNLVENQNNPQLRMRYARALADAGQCKEALSEYLWCYDHGLEYDEGFRGVRLSFLLGDISNLGEQYPLAIDALKERRDKVEKVVYEKMQGATITQVREVVSLNEALNEKMRSLTLFEKFRENQIKQFCNVILEDVIDDLILTQRYGDILDSTPDLSKTIQQIMYAYQSLEDYIKKEKGNALTETNKLSLTISKNLCIERAGKFYEALLGVNKIEEANKLEAQLIVFNANKETFINLIKHANRVNNNERVKSLLSQAAKTLPESDYLLVQKTVEENKK